MANELPSSSSAQASVLFVKIRDFAGMAVTQQAKTREHLLAIMTAAVAVWEDNARVVLDAPDGAAIVGLGDAALALDAAVQARQAAGDSALCIGLHHGPVMALQGELGGVRVLGDGIDTAATVSGFATARQILVSTSFRDALASRSPQRAQALLAVGEFVDERLRAHALFVLDPETAHARERRRTLLGVGAIAGILGLGFAARVTLEAIEAARRPAVIQLDIKPWGDVYVDGEMKGAAPPLNRLWIKPGTHVIEVRNGRFKPLKLEVQLKPGEEMEVKHVFGGNPGKKPGLLDRLKFW